MERQVFLHYLFLDSHMQNRNRKGNINSVSVWHFYREYTATAIATYDTCYTSSAGWTLLCERQSKWDNSIKCTILRSTANPFKISSFGLSLAVAFLKKSQHTFCIYCLSVLNIFFCLVSGEFRVTWARVSGTR